MPSFKKLKSKLSIRKSHSTASNLSEILGKNKLSNSTSINNFKLVNNTTPVNKSPNDTSSPSQIEARLKSSISATPIKKPQTAHNIDSIEEEPQLQTANVPCIMRQQLKEKSIVNSRTNSPLHQSTITKSDKEHKHHNNPITELLSSLSFSLSSSNNHRNQNLGNNHHAVKMRQSGKSNGNALVNNQKKADIAQKRISLPANYVSQISSSSSTLSHSHVNSKFFNTVY